jgi:HlyD family secretion protein
MWKWVIGVLLLVLVGGGGGAAWRWYGAADGQRTAIRGSGIIEVTQVDVAFEVPGRVVERLVDEGMIVQQGDPVARLDEAEYRLQVERATAAKAAAEARYNMMVKGSRAQDVDRALHALESAESALDLAQREFERISRLASRGIVSGHDRDRANNDLNSARAGRDQASAQLDMLREGSRIEEIEMAHAQLKLAASELQLAELNLARCRLDAPMAGRVLSKSREPGEMVQPGTPIVTLGDLSRPWVNLYVGERDLGKVQFGMKANVFVDSFPGRAFPGSVSFVSERAEFTPKNIQTPDERVKLVYRVKVELDGRDQILKPGMPADTVLPLASNDARASAP